MPPKDWCDPAKETFWRAEIEKCSKTELSGREYCRRQRLSYSKFHNWKRRLQKVGERRPAKPPASAPNLNWVRIMREEVDGKFPTDLSGKKIAFVPDDAISFQRKNGPAHFLIGRHETDFELQAKNPTGPIPSPSETPQMKFHLEH
jgi:hypothetical protein